MKTEENGNASWDDLMDEEFEGDWTPLEPMKVPSIEKLPMAAHGIIQRRLGIDMQSQDGNLAMKIAANEWFWRRTRGQQVTFRQVLRGGAMDNIDMQKPEQGDGEDPTQPTG